MALRLAVRASLSNKINKNMRPFLQFPQLFFLAPMYVPILLRLAAGLVFLFIAWHTYSRRDEIAEIQLPVVGKATWAVWFAFVVEIAIGLSLLLGYYAQIGAIAGALAGLKFAILKRRIGGYAPISRTASLLLFIICLALLFTGAGGFAFDRFGL